MSNYSITKGSYLFAALILVESLITLVTFNVNAQNIKRLPHADISAETINNSRQSDKAFILWDTHERPQDIDNLALLLQQVEDNKNYTPLLVVQNEAMVKKILNKVNWLSEQTPAFVFYDKQGQEIKHVLKSP